MSGQSSSAQGVKNFKLKYKGEVEEVLLDMELKSASKTVAYVSGTARGTFIYQ